MAGAAACAGAMLALARRNSPAPAAAVLALAENMTGARRLPPVRRVAHGRTAPRWRWSTRMRRGGWCWPMRSAGRGGICARWRMIDLATLTGSIVTWRWGARWPGCSDNDAALRRRRARRGRAGGARAGVAHADRRRPPGRPPRPTSPTSASACQRPRPAGRLPRRRLPAGVRGRTRRGPTSTSPAPRAAPRRDDRRAAGATGLRRAPAGPPGERSASRIRTGERGRLLPPHPHDRGAGAAQAARPHPGRRAARRGAVRQRRRGWRRWTTRCGPAPTRIGCRTAARAPGRPSCSRSG